MPRFYDPNQPRVPRGHDDGGQWTDDAHVHQAFAKSPTRPPIAPGPIRLLGIALSLFARLSLNNSDDERAVIEINARDFSQDPDGAVKVKVLTRKEVKEVCKAIDTVQEMTDRNDREVRRDNPDLTPTQHGTEVHKQVDLEIKLANKANLRSEVSRVKTAEARAAAAKEGVADPARDAKYGTKGSVRIDVLEEVSHDTVCVYDMKTGESGFSHRRMAHLFEVLSKHGAKRVILMEIRPQ